MFLWRKLSDRCFLVFVSPFVFFFFSFLNKLIINKRNSFWRLNFDWLKLVQIPLINLLTDHILANLFDLREFQTLWRNLIIIGFYVLLIKQVDRLSINIFWFVFMHSESVPIFKNHKKRTNLGKWSLLFLIIKTEIIIK